MRISDWSSDLCSSDLEAGRSEGGRDRSGQRGEHGHAARQGGVARLYRFPLGDVGFGVGSGRSSPTGGGGPCEAWWRGTRGVSCPLYVTRLRPCPSTTFCGPPPRSWEDRPPPAETGHSPPPRATICRTPLCTPPTTAHHVY